jgi:hypothetical protein
MIDADLERRLERLRLTQVGLSGSTCPASGSSIDTARAWRELQLLRDRRGRSRRGWLVVVAAAAAAAVAVAVPALAYVGPHSKGPTLPGTRSHSPSPAPSPRSYPSAVVARIKLGGVSTVVQDGTRAWAVRGGRPTRSGHFTTQLVGIDLRTNTIALRKTVGPFQSAVAAGGGRVWLTTAAGEAKGQIERLDPATGRVIATLHLPAGRCYYATYASGSLWATCAAGGAATEFFRIDPATGHVRGRVGPVRDTAKACQWWMQSPPCPIRQIAVARAAVWYISGNLGLRGVVGVGGRERNITVNVRDYPVGFDYHAQSLVAAQGFIWALTEDESMAQIDPATGQVVRTYTYRTYDPSYQAALSFFAVGHGSLWFAEWPAKVLRVSLATGRPVSQVSAFTPNLCRYGCGEIYSTSSAIWVPAGHMLIRINPAKLPG